ncbi:MAG TPA: protein kinase [Gemmatimonadales bacterium]
MPEIAERLATALEGRYRIERELGSGGMATVYLADDLRHGRQVAIKLLHPELSAVLGPERFLAEIKTTAGLQHPHILPLFDSGAADGLLFYVMPYVQGETLRRRLQREHQLPLADAIRLATQVADALGYAHAQGIIHRDVKPENILIQGGHALVADFGIALAVEQAGGSRLTQTGLSLGTPHYMAPEQAMGERHVDARADVYALGAVTYEMLAGEPPFTGPTAQAVVAKVITERPRPLLELRETVPPHVAAAVHAALQKLPADRPPTAAEFARALGGEGAVLPTQAVAAPRAGRSGSWLIAVEAAVIAGLAGYALGRLGAPTPPPLPPSRLAIMAPMLGGTGLASTHRQLALTPDGSGIVFVADNPGTVLAYQRLDDAEARLIPGAELMMDVLISPDGRWVLGNGTSSALGGDPNQAYRLPLTGGTPTTLPRGTDTRWADLGSDGSLWFSANYGGIRHLKPDGTVDEALDKRTVGLRVQQVLPGDRMALVIRSPVGAGSGPLSLLDLEDGAGTSLIETQVVQARYTAGHVVYAVPDGGLWAVPFDGHRKRFGGAPVQIASGVSLTGSQSAQFAVAPNGTVAYIPEEPRSLVLADRTGAMRLATQERRNFHMPRFSPDGRRVSVDFTAADGRDVWILNLRQGTLSRATFDRDGHDATWTPDGRFLTYTSFKSGEFGLYRNRPGSDAPGDSLRATDSIGFTGYWLPDGSGLVTVAQDLRPGSGADIALIRNGGRGPIEPLVATSYQAQYPALSPDGRWIAFVSDHSGSPEVYVRSMAGPGEEVQVSAHGGSEPLWGPEGRELFYKGGSARGAELVRVELRTAPELEVVSRQALFPIGEIAGSAPHGNYDISPDGKTFVMVRRSPATRIIVLQNLPALVARLREASPGAR